MSRVKNRTIFFCNVIESHECACCLLSFLYFHWLFPLLVRETSSGSRSIYKSTWERVDSKGLCGRWRLLLMGSCKNGTIFLTKLTQNFIWLAFALFCFGITYRFQLSRRWISAAKTVAAQPRAIGNRQNIIPGLH